MHPLDTRDLIATARATLKADVLPHLPPDRRYSALMVLNALGIALRQLEAGSARRAAAAAALAPFAEGDDLDARLADLAGSLRAGRALDPDLHAALVAVARAATEESNPGARPAVPQASPVPQRDRK
jgi:hypothetical protein